MTAPAARGYPPSETVGAVLAAVDLLAPRFAESGLDEMEVEVDELLVRLARPRASLPAELPPAAPLAAPRADAGAASAPVAESDALQPQPGMRFITAPLTGIWYSAPSPGARDYKEEGDEISVGQVIGLIEAMKLFNEIKSDVAGTVIRILVENGTLVKRQQPLFEVDPS